MSKWNFKRKKRRIYSNGRKKRRWLPKRKDHVWSRRARKKQSPSSTIRL
jgi:hypothetical protein